MKKIYLHIGMHKTGSSSIQTSLFNSRDSLEAQGVSYFSEYFNGQFGVLPQDWIFTDGFIGSPEIKDPMRFVKAIDSLPYDNVIISIESFSWFIDEASISKLKKVLDKFQVCLIVYLRRQDKQFISYTQEGSKAKNKPSNQYYGRGTGSLPEISRYDYLDYYTRVRHYIKYFGRDNVTVKLFERDKLIGGDVVFDFCNEVGIKNVTSIKVNESLGFQRQKVGQLINLSSIKNKNLEHFLRANLSNEGKMLPSKSKALSFYSRYKENNRKLNQLLSLSTNEYLFEDDFSEYPLEEGDIWDEKTANETIIHLINLFSEYSQSSLIDPCEHYIDALRDDAIAMENENVAQSYHLMNRAHELRPKGALIKKKLIEYREAIGAQTKPK